MVVAALRYFYYWSFKSTCRRQTIDLQYSIDNLQYLSPVFEGSLAGGFKGAAP
jgi:hypothetical protein